METCVSITNSPPFSIFTIKTSLIELSVWYLNRKEMKLLEKKKVSSYWLLCLWLQMLLVKKEILMRIFWWNIFSKTPMSLVGCGCGFKEDSRQSSEIRLLADSQQFFFVVRVTNRMLNHSFWNEPNPAVDPLKLITLFINFDKLEPLRSSHH